jgi:hypothetical protein
MPILISQEQYDHAMAVIRNEKLLTPYFKELKDYIKEYCDFDVLDFYLDHHFSDCDVKDKTRVYMLMTRQISYQENRFRRKLELINQKMMELNSKYHFIPEDKLYEHIGFYNFKPIYVVESVSKASETAIPVLKQKYQDYRISNIINSGLGMITVFYMTREDVERNKKDGISETIENDFLNYLPKVDELNWIDLHKAYVSFDSQEILDQVYHGNLYQYYK